jgi:plastocyanin
MIFTRTNLVSSLCNILGTYLILLLTLASNNVFSQCLLPTNLETTNISLNSVTFNWEVNQEASFYRVSYGQNGGSWAFASDPVNIDPTSSTLTVDGLEEYTTYDWRIKSYCEDGLTSSNWSSIVSFNTSGSDLLDCNGEAGGAAFIDNCDNCVGGSTDDEPCLDFSPLIDVAISSTLPNTISDLNLQISQDANEPDISLILLTSSAGSFDFEGLNVNDQVGLGSAIAGGEFYSSDFSLFVDFIVDDNNITLVSIDNLSGNVVGTFELENTNDGIKILSISPPDGNNVTNGNELDLIISGLFMIPDNVSLDFYFDLTSEVSTSFSEIFSFDLGPSDCNGDVDGSAFIDDCGNCVGGNTSHNACVTFAPEIEIILSNSSCAALTDVTMLQSQTANQPDMSTSLLTSNGGSFDFSSITADQIVGSASLVAAGGEISYNGDLVIGTIISSSQIVLEVIDLIDAEVLGSFILSNNESGVSIATNSSFDDGNNVTAGNNFSLTINNLFLNPGGSEITFFTSINAEVASVAPNSQSFVLPLEGTSSSLFTQVSCDSFEWNGTIYEESGIFTFESQNESGCLNIDSLNLTINESSSALLEQTTCDSFEWNDTTYTESGIYTFVSNVYTPQNYTINAGSYYYSPSILTINKGDSVTWINDGGFHNVNGSFSALTGESYNNPESFQSSATGNAGAIIYTHTFTIPGTYNYDCSIGSHAVLGMVGSIIVNVPLVCSTTTTLDLTINNSSSFIEETACDSFVWNGTTYSESGIYTFESTNTFGCSNIDSLDLTLIQIPDVIFSVSDASEYGANDGLLNLESNEIFDNFSFSVLGSDEQVLGLSGLTAGEYILVTLDNDSGCENFQAFFVNQPDEIIEGCTDSAADNYNPNANTDDDSCTYCNDFQALFVSSSNETGAGELNGTIQATGQGGSANYSLTVLNADGLPQNAFGLTGGTYTAVITDEEFGCTESLTVTIITIVEGCTDSDAFNYNIDANTDDGSCIDIIEGCTDSNAFNYNIDANTEDGSCIDIILGCTDSEASNYDASANTDDNSCVSGNECSLEGDANCDGIVNLADLALVINNWLSPVDVFTNGDLDGDSFVNLADLALVINNWLNQAD